MYVVKPTNQWRVSIYVVNQPTKQWRVGMYVVNQAMESLVCMS